MTSPIQMHGLRPKDAPEIGLPIFHCPHCFAPVVAAWDDLVTEPLAANGADELARRTVDLEPSPAAAGSVVLWYQVNEDGAPIGRQMFRRWEAGQGYDGPAWTFHASTCRKVNRPSSWGKAVHDGRA